jgi:hypothetical protein
VARIEFAHPAGSRAFILEVTALDTLAESAKGCADDYSRSGVRICSRCRNGPEATTRDTKLADPIELGRFGLRA